MNSLRLLCVIFVLSAGLSAFASLADRTAELESGARLVTLVSFNITNGCWPEGNLVLGKDGNFYGVTQYGGASRGQGRFGLGYGTVFRVTTDGILTTLASFNLTNGANPQVSLTRSQNGDFYGTTYAGGTNLGNGTVFRISSHGHFTSLHSFGSNGELDSFVTQHGITQWQGVGVPMAPLMSVPDGTFYGTTVDGGFDSGTIFHMTANGRLSYVHLFNQTSGAKPTGNLCPDADGNIYGTTSAGGSNGSERGGYGTVFKINPDWSTAWCICLDGTNGLHPTDGLVAGPDGYFYGTTSGGYYGSADHSRKTSIPSAFNCGTIFRVTPNGVLTTLVLFDNTNGACPVGNLVLAKDGNFYGAVRFYNAFSLGASSIVFGSGAIIKITPAGKLSLVAALADQSENICPAGGLTEGTEGILYGMTDGGGVNHEGSIFKLILPGTISHKQP